MAGPDSDMPLRGIVTREAMIEYLNLQRWSRQTCAALPLTLGLWLSLLALVSFRAHTEASFGIRQAMTKHVMGLTADLSKGASPVNLPREVASTQGEARCTCSCAPEGFSLCQTHLPTVADFNGTIALENMKYLRARSQYFEDMTQDLHPMKWDQLRTLDDVWFWVQHGFLPAVWHEEPSSLPLPVQGLFGSEASLGAPTAPPGRLLHWSQLVGGVRLRQRRVQREDCSGDERVTARFGQICHSSSPSVDAFGPGAIGEGYYADGFMPESAERGAFDVYLDISRSIYEILEIMEHGLQGLGWLDDSTAELVLQAAFLNGEAVPALYGLLEVRFVFDESGALRQTIRVDTTAAEEYPGLVYVVLDITWISLVFLMLLANVRKVILHFTTRRGADEYPLLSFWTALDWITLLVSFGIFAGRLLIAFDATRVGNKIAEVPSSPPPFGAELDDMKAYHGLWGSVLDNIIHINSWMEVYRLSIFAYCIVLTFEIFKVFRGNPKLAQMANALRHAVEDLIHFFVVFLVLFLSFAFGGYMIYGLYLEPWSSPATAVNSCFRSLLGDTDLAAMYEVAPITTVVWYFLFLVVMIFLMLNLLLAITYDHYGIVKMKCGQTAGIGLQLRFMLRDMRSRALGRGCAGLCCPCRRNSSFPRHFEVMEELLRRCDLPAEERRSALSSVLGLRMRNKELKRHTFAEGQVSTNSMKLMRMPAEKDLQQLGVDPDYVEVLLDECSAHARREHGPAERKVYQLRELVNMAAADIQAMRERLGACSGVTKACMYELSSRLEVLERMVHYSLADLVYIAGCAGVADAKPAQSPGQRAKLDGTVGALRSLSPAARTESMLTGSVGRVLEQLGHGGEVAKETRAAVGDWHRAMRRIDTRGKRAGPEGAR